MPLAQRLETFQNTHVGTYRRHGAKDFRIITQRRVLTHNTSLSWPNVTVVHTLDEIPIQDTTEDEIFIMGGATLYNETIKIADTLYITHIHHTFDDADTFFPTINPSEWKIANSQEMPADEKHAYPYTFVTYTRRRIENREPSDK